MKPVVSIDIPSAFSLSDWNAWRAEILDRVVIVKPCSAIKNVVFAGDTYTSYA